MPYHNRRRLSGKSRLARSLDWSRLGGRPIPRPISDGRLGTADRRVRDDPARCRAVGVPATAPWMQVKRELVLAMARHQCRLGMRCAWVGADGFHDKDPALLRALDRVGEAVLVDVHKESAEFSRGARLSRRQEPARAGPRSSTRSARSASRYGPVDELIRPRH